MTKLIVNRRLRPLRLAFLIRPGDGAEFRKAVQICTTQWGGQFNFIVPGTQRARRARSGWLQITGKQYLDAIEPDLVVGGKLDPESFGVPPERSRTFKDFLDAGGDPVGADVMAVYRWRYQNDFRYVLRDPIPLRRCRGSGKLAMFAAACFGEAPKRRRGQLEQAFLDLGGQTEPLTAMAFAKAWTESITPLRLGASDVKVNRGERTAFLLLDAANVSDLLDFWNLRALGWRVFPVPVEWIDELAPVVSDWIAKNHQPAPPLKDIVTRATIARGDGVGDRDFARLQSALRAPASNFVVYRRVPRLTAGSPLDDLTPPKLSAHEDQTMLDATDGTLSFAALAPKFDLGHVGMRPVCATVVSLKSWSRPDLPEVFPRGLSDRVLGGLAAKGSRLVHTEGITLLDDGPGASCFMDVPSGLSVFQGWLAPNVRVDLSAAGNIAHRMLLAMGGPEYSRIWTRPNIVRLFEIINRDASRSMLHARFKEALRKECLDDAMTERVLLQWIEHRALALGIAIQCSKCGQRNWFEAASQFRKLECHRCLESFPFPVANPRRDVDWAVRALGPFSVEQHAHGAFAVAAALRVLKDIGGHVQTTWVPSVTLRRDKWEREVDFMMLRQSDLRRLRKPLLLLGECKTFGVFEQADVKKMYELGRAFPGAVLVFAKLADSFAPSEKSLLRKLAERCRKGANRNPVLLLTSRELSGDFGPPHCWETGSHDEKVAAKAVKPWQFDLVRVCEASVALRLGLPASLDNPLPSEND